MATERLQILKCGKCGTIVEVLHAGGGQPACCGEPMMLLKENTVDASREKHVPVIEKTAGGVKVKVGAIPHPMEAAHLIEWIQVVDGDTVARVFLKPGVPAEASFATASAKVTAREFCNLHGLWKA
jgi:superoxide reductase